MRCSKSIPIKVFILRDFIYINQKKIDLKI